MLVARSTAERAIQSSPIWRHNSKLWRFLMKPIFFNVEDISGYKIILLLITLYSNVQEIRLHQSVANNITTLTDSALLHLCIDFVLFFLEVGKEPTNHSQQSASFSIFLSNICYASEGRYSNMLYVRASTFRENRTKACASINFSFSVSIYGWIMWH